MKKTIKSYFTFSKKERTAAIILVAVIGVFIALPYLITTPKKEKQLVNNEVKEQLSQLKKLQNDSSKNGQEESWHTSFTPSETIAETKFELFEFDPNTLDAAGWKRLGLRDKTINTIFNYRNKGGKFKKPEDISKIWGLQPDIAQRIIPYAKIEGSQNTYQKQSFTNNYTTAKKASIIDINTATAFDFKDIPGIENGLQYRIIKYRERLGGFINISQIREANGVSDTSFQLMKPYLKIEQNNILKLNINNLSDYELGSHPYINKTIAKAIVVYRGQHGNYHTIHDLRNIVFIKDSVFQKISPYLTVE